MKKKEFFDYFSFGYRLGIASPMKRKKNKNNYRKTYYLYILVKLLFECVCFLSIHNIHFILIHFYSSKRKFENKKKSILFVYS